jgi:hypothetical protein
MAVIVHGSLTYWRALRPVILDRAGPFEVIEQDRLRVEDQLDLVPHDHPAAGKLVLPGDAESWRLMREIASKPIRRSSPLFSSPSQNGVLHSPR